MTTSTFQPAPAWATDPASAAQLRYLTSLNEQRDCRRIADRDIDALDTCMNLMDGKPISKGEASRAIEVLKALPRTAAAPEPVGAAQRNADAHYARTGQPNVEFIYDQRGNLQSVGAAGSPAVSPVVTEDGMYLRPADGAIFKVQRAVHGSGHLYAKVLRIVPEGERRLVRGKERVAEFDYAPGAMQTLTAEMRMTLEQAKEWGALYGTCVRCGITLTREESIERSMGPVCASKI